jgi:acetyl-CoA synthetase
MNEIDALLNEERKFPPPPQFAANAVVNDPAIYDEAARDPEAYWAREAARLD